MNHLFTEFPQFVWGIRIVDIMICLFGALLLVRPSFANAGNLDFTPQYGYALRLPMRTIDTLLRIERTRESVQLDYRFLRLGGATLMLIGIAGIVTSVPLPVTFSALSLVMALATTFALLMARRTDGGNVAVLDARTPTQIVPSWLFLIAGISGLAMIVSGTWMAIVVGTTCLLGLIATWVATQAPAIVFGHDLDLELQIDYRYRLGRVLAVLFFATQLPPIAYESINLYLDVTSLRIITLFISLAAMFSVIVFTFLIRRKSDRELRNVARA
jgi:hypothetical protein